MRKKCGEGFADPLKRTSRDLKKRLTNLRFGRREKRRMQDGNYDHWEEESVVQHGDNDHQKGGMSGRKSKKRKGSHLPLPCLPDEVILSHVLPRLPAKSLCRFSSVSKIWCSAMDDKDPKFVSAHMRHSKQKPPLFLGVFHVHELQEEKHKGKGKGRKPSTYYNFISFNPSSGLPTTSNYHCFRSARRAAKSFIVGYCNGLFCIRSRSGFEITNLSTREVLLLPPPPPLPRPLRSNYITRYGFGFDPVKNHFKIVQLVDGRRCLVFTLGTESNSSSWRDISVPVEVSSILNLYSHPNPEICPADRNTALYAVKYLHWLLVLPSFSIMSFDIHTEEFLLIPAPYKFSEFDFVTRYFFFEIKGLLSCGCQVGNFVYLSLLLNDPFSNPNPNPIWKEKTLHLPLPGRPPFSPFPLTCFLDCLVSYIYDHSTLAIFYRKHSKNFNFVTSPPTLKIFPPDARFDQNVEPFFINHVENLLSLKRLVPPGAASVQIIQGRWT